MTDRPSPSRAVARRLLPWAGLAIVAASLLLGSHAVRVFDEAVEPELNRRTHLIGSTVRANIQLALDSGIPLEAIAGADRYLANVLQGFGEISSLALVAESGTVVAEARRNEGGADGAATGAREASPGESRSYRLERIVIPVLDGNLRVGRIEVGVDRQYISTQFRNIFLDVAVVIVVAILMAFEILFAVVTRSFTKPLDGLTALVRRQADGRFDRVQHNAGTGGSLIDRLTERFSDHAADLHARCAELRARLASGGEARAALEHLATRLGLRADAPERVRQRDAGDMRLPFFLFVLAEELSKPFLPLYIRDRLGAEPWLDAELLIGLPLLTYLACIALLSPFGRALTLRFGARRLFLMALVPVVCAHVGLAFSTTAWEIAAWRGLVGGAFALLSLACQDYALTSGGHVQPGRAVGGFIAVLIGGTFCGTALGGVLADRLGQSNVFLAGALVTVAAGALALRLMTPDDTARTDTHGRRLRDDLARIFRNRRIATLVLGISIPASALAVSLLWYLVPLLTGQVGISVADTGRIMMIYYLAIILLGPLVAARAGSGAPAALLPFVGAVLSGGALLVLAGDVDALHLILAVLAVGIGHALLRAPLIATCLRAADAQFGAGAGEGLLGTLQLTERIGSLLGLASVTLLASLYGYGVTLAVTGAVALLGAAAYAVAEMTRRRTARIHA